MEIQLRKKILIGSQYIDEENLMRKQKSEIEFVCTAFFWGNFLNSNPSFFSSKPTMKNRSTVFTLGNRGDILTTELEGPVIVPHAAAKNDTRVRHIYLYFETLVDCELIMFNRSIHFKGFVIDRPP